MSREKLIKCLIQLFALDIESSIRLNGKIVQAMNLIDEYVEECIKDQRR